MLYLKDAFEKEEYLATVVEPRQCEGGDRFASPRFIMQSDYSHVHTMSPYSLTKYKPATDWADLSFGHEQFQLKKADGTPDHPDCLTFAKKAQVAGVSLPLLRAPSNTK